MNGKNRAFGDGRENQELPFAQFFKKYKAAFRYAETWLLPAMSLRSVCGQLRNAIRQYLVGDNQWYP